MKNRELYAEERREKIVQYLQANARCSVRELSSLFATTPVTIRSDLRVLEQVGQLVRTHGGAMIRSKVMPEDYLHERHNDDVKNKIATTALDFLSNGDSIVLDTGTTACAFASALVQSKIKNVKVITSDFAILNILEKREDFEVIALGGKMRHGFHFAYGDLTLQTLDQFRVDKCILTTSAIDFEQGLTTPNIDTANLKAKMVSIAKEVILISDSSKFNKVCFSKICNLQQIHILIVDNGVQPAYIEEAKKYISEIVISK